MTAATTLQEVDPDDLSTVIWDYADSTGAANPGTVQTRFGIGGAFNLAAPGVQINSSNRLGDGAQDVTFTYDDIVSSSFRMRATATSYDNLRTGIGTLQRILSADGVMRWVPGGSSNTYYIYRKPSNIPALFVGDDLELFKRLSLFDTPEGVEIVINRERLLRGPTLLASVNKLLNGTLLMCVSTAAKSMYFWDWDSGTNITTNGYGANVNWATQSYRFAIATTGTRNFQQNTAAASAAPGDVWTFSFDVSAAGGALAKAQAVLEFINSGTTVLATASGVLTTLANGGGFTRLTVTSSAAPASTDHIRVNLRMANGDATSYTVDFRRAQLEKAAAASLFRGGVETVANDMTTGAFRPGKALFAYNPGDANALARLTLTPSTGSNPVALLLGRKSEGLDVNLTEAVNHMTSSLTTYRTKAGVINTTLYSGSAGDTSAVADAAATFANATKTTFTNQSSLVRRWRWVTTPTDPEALHGVWDVYAAVRGETGSAFRICMHWQAANRDPVTNVEDEITYDCTDTASSVYTPLHLGQVSFDANAGDASLTIEGWAARDDANANSLWWDVVYLIPADEQQTLLSVPGFRKGQQSTETWLGSEVTSRVAGTIAGSGATATNTPAGSTKVILAEQYEGVGTPPSTTTTGGIVWAAGRHVVTARAALINTGTALTFGKVRIRKASGIGGGGVSAWAATTTYAVGDFVKPTVANLIGRTYVATAIGSAPHHSGGAEPTWPDTNGATVASGDITFTETTVAAASMKSKDTYTSTTDSWSAAYDADGSTAYEGVVVFTAPTVAGRKLVLLTLKHSTQRVVDSGYSAQMIGDTEVLQTVNGSTSIDDLVASGPFITLGPGLNVLWIDLWSLAPSGYDDIDPRNPLAFHDPTQSTTVSVDLVPRWWS